uniref:Uncharacterized protein n=1 Tax=Guillardia theta TaxID=55529 RepID=A0A7S4H8J2_GUITH
MLQRESALPALVQTHLHLRFSLRFQYPRSSVLRVFRDYTYRQLGLKLPQLETKEAGAWRVPSLLACYKVARGAMNPPHWPSACEDVRVILAQFSTPIDSTCINPASLPLTGQVQAVKQATTILSEHGTVSYVALFARDGLPLVVVGKPPMKEAHVLLQMTHVYTVYVDVAEGQEGIKAALLVVLKVGRPT